MIKAVNGNWAKRLSPTSMPSSEPGEQDGAGEGWLCHWGWAESQHWAQVFFPKFPDPWYGAPEPHSLKAACALLHLLSWEICIPLAPPGGSGSGDCWVLVTDAFWAVNSNNSCWDFEELQGHNIHFPFSVAGVGNSTPGACACLLLEMIELSY